MTAPAALSAIANVRAVNELIFFQERSAGMICAGFLLCVIARALARGKRNALFCLATARGKRTSVTSLFPHAELHVVLNAGHFIELEQPDRVADELRPFLRT